jgi:nicotinamidase/pyrazinamidase
MPFPARSALLIVDVQRDFCPGGALAVRDGDEVVAPINRVATAAHDGGAPVFASRDWHPPTSTHFAVNGGVWPVHCVADSEGAAFHPNLDLPEGTVVVTKGDTPADPDGYDAFEGHLPDGTPLADALRARRVTRVVVAGLATDYCVKNSVMGARRAGFDVTVLTDAIRAVEVEPGDSQRAIADMIAAGAELAESADLLH